MLTPASTPAHVPDIVSPIYQKVLGCQLQSAESSSTPSADIDMTDPTAALRSLLSSKRPIRNNASMILPTSTVVSYTQGGYASSTTYPNSLNPSVDSCTNSRLDDHHHGGDDAHVYLTNEHSNSKEPRVYTSFTQTQEQYKVFRADNRHLHEKDFESMSRLQTNVSPGSDSRFSEGDQTVPHSVSPTTESPSFASSDECSAAVQATFVPPPEVLMRHGTGHEKSQSIRVSELQDSDLNGIQSLDNYEYFIHKVDQHSLESQDTENHPTKINDICKDSKIVEANTDHHSKSTNDQTVNNKPEVAVRIRIDDEEECYVVENDSSKDDEPTQDNIPVNDIMRKDKQMENNHKSDKLRIDDEGECYVVGNDSSKDDEPTQDNIPVNDIMRKDKQMENNHKSDRQYDPSAIITLDSDGTVQLDEELSEMRRYYLDCADEHASASLMPTGKGSKFFNDAGVPQLGPGVCQNLANIGQINSLDFYNELQRGSKLIERDYLKRNAPVSGRRMEHTSIFGLGQEGEYYFRWKDTPEKRYYLKDEAYTTDIEPGEIVHNKSSSRINMFPHSAYFNISDDDGISKDKPTISRNVPQKHSCATASPGMMSANCRHPSLMSMSSSHDRPLDFQPYFERHFGNAGKYSTGLRNAELRQALNIGENKKIDNNNMAQKYSSILFPVSINMGNFSEIPDSNRSKVKLPQKCKRHKELRQNDWNLNNSSSSVRYDLSQMQRENHKRFLNNETHLKSAVHNTPKHTDNSCSKIVGLGLKSRKNNKTPKNTTRHLNGIIEKLWSSKTCSNDSVTNETSSVTNSETDFSNSAFPKSSCENPRKSKNTYVKVFECLACGFQDQRYSGMEKHVAAQHKPDGCTCDSCGQTLINHCQCKGRIKVSSKAVTFECNICRKLCRTRSGLRRHKAKIHSSDIVSCLSAYQPPYTCTVCGQDQHVYSRYKQHMVAHGNNTPFTCKTCCKSFHSKNGLALHFAKVHRL